MDRERFSIAQRKSYRFTAVFPFAVAQWLFKHAAEQGRSVSNLIAHLVELAMCREQENAAKDDRR